MWHPYKRNTKKNDKGGNTPPKHTLKPQSVAAKSSRKFKNVVVPAAQKQQGAHGGREEFYAKGKWLLPHFNFCGVPVYLTHKTYLPFTPRKADTLQNPKQ
jgi:hypothetical protein